MAVKEIMREELRAKLDRGEEVVLVEMLEPSYYENAHLPGAINIPHTEVERLAPEMLPDKSVAVVMYCSNMACQNPPQAARKPVALGYENVYDYAEGKQDRIGARLPTESGAARVTARGSGLADEKGAGAAHRAAPAPEGNSGSSR